MPILVLSYTAEPEAYSASAAETQCRSISTRQHMRSDIRPASPSGWSCILIPRCYFSALMVYFRCRLVVSCVMFVCACLWHSTMLLPFFCIEKRQRDMSRVFNSPHGQKGGERKAGERKKEENWKLLRQTQKQESRSRMGRGKKTARYNTSLPLTHSLASCRWLELSLLYFLEEIEME